jgi:hypothetical protein
MLTKEEADKLRNQLCGNLINLGFGNIKLIVDSFTEKPKPKIKVGDIYLDKQGMPREIVEICYGEQYPVRTTNLSYTIEGIYKEDSTSYKNDLDLTKIYKLVEITGE